MFLFARHADYFFENFLSLEYHEVCWFQLELEKSNNDKNALQERFFFFFFYSMVLLTCESEDFSCNSEAEHPACNDEVGDETGRVGD